jgi:uncharacterized protein (TIGR02246 family)
MLDRPFVRATALLVAIACAGSAASESGTDARQRIRRQGEQHVEAWIHNDAARTASMYAGNGILSFPDAPDARGTAAVRDLLTAFFTSTRVDSIQVTPDTIEVFGDIAYEWGTYREVYRPEGKPAVREEGRYVMRWTHEADGEWKISRFTGNTVHRSSGTAPSAGT